MLIVAYERAPGLRVRQQATSGTYMLMKMRSTSVLVVAVGLGFACAGTPPAPAPAMAVSPVSVASFAPPPAPAKTHAPAAARESVKNIYHSVEIDDPYRWLEDLSSERVKAFAKEQNEWARKHLDALPNHEGLRARLKEILGAKFATYRLPAAVGRTLFALKLEPPRQQPMLVTMLGPDGTEAERVLVDPNTLDASGHTAIDWFRPSPDGKYVAVSLSQGGSEAGDVHVFATGDGKEVFEVVPRVQGGTAGGDLQWLRDSKSFFYTHYPRGTERPPADAAFFVQVYRHTLGTPADKDVYELGADFPRVAETRLSANGAGQVLAEVQNGDNGEFMHFLRGLDGKWKQLTRFEDGIVQIVFGEKNDFYLTSRQNAARGKLLRAPIAGFSLAKAKVIVPEGKDTLMFDFYGNAPVLAHGGHLYAIYQLGGPSEIRMFDLDGKPQARPMQLPVSSAFHLAPLDKAQVLFANVSFVEPINWIQFDPGKGETRKTKMSTRTPVDLAGVKVAREMATSKDGTQIPVNVLLPKDYKEGTSIPFELTAYGGFGISIGPNFQPMSSVLLERGVGLAIANLRGGGEFGEEWHKQGSLTHKQNVFDDFAAAFEHLRARKYAIPDRIAIVGGSNGGLLMGAMLTQHPELPRVVVSFVGVYDMLRLETDANGAFNATEFGTVKDAEQFKALYAYSPFHRVREATAYPPVLLLTGENDTRVAPWHSHKMAAQLQHASSSQAPILERIEASAGHGMGSALDTIVEQHADAYAFMLHHLGL
ncbi:MAG TPA: prolyl oligopeptidase family serine peptidase [Polyangiaceae bacterium]|nr:prolyl oligopeptidase family serine peptidase [Polyangiaceae bacterium]